MTEAPGFKSVAFVQRFWSVHGVIQNLFRIGHPAAVSQPPPLTISLLPCLARGHVCLMTPEASHKASQPHSNDAKLTVPWAQQSAYSNTENFPLGGPVRFPSYSVDEFQRELDLARRASRPTDEAKPAPMHDVGRKAEIDQIEKIEEFRPELQVRS